MRGKGMYAKYGKQKMNEAIEAVKNGMPLVLAARRKKSSKYLKLSIKFYISKENFQKKNSHHINTLFKLQRNTE